MEIFCLNLLFTKNKNLTFGFFPPFTFRKLTISYSICLIFEPEKNYFTFFQVADTKQEGLPGWGTKESQEISVKMIVVRHVLMMKIATLGDFKP